MEKRQICRGGKEVQKCDRKEPSPAKAGEAGSLAVAGVLQVSSSISIQRSG